MTNLHLNSQFVHQNQQTDRPNHEREDHHVYHCPLDTDSERSRTFQSMSLLQYRSVVFTWIWWPQQGTVTECKWSSGVSLVHIGGTIAHASVGHGIGQLAPLDTVWCAPGDEHCVHSGQSGAVLLARPNLVGVAALVHSGHRSGDALLARP